MTLPNIALTGRLRSGKDTAAAYLVERYGYVRFAFGDELKRYYHELFGETETKPREGYQWFGQAMRQRDPDVWVRKCFEQIAEEAADRRPLTKYNGFPPLRAVITDLRQPNEFERCRSEGYVIIRINCPESLRIHRAIESADKFALADLTHETEQHVDSFAVDYEVNNADTVDDLYAQIDAILTEVSA